MFPKVKLQYDSIELPSLPVIIQKLHGILDQEGTTSVSGVASIIETDPAFTAKVLSLVNSPFYGCSRKVISVGEAITILGFSTIHQLLLTTSILNVFKSCDSELNIKDFWIHSFAVGTVAKKLLRHSNNDTRNEAFVCGILHDIGRMVYISKVPDLFQWFYYERSAVTDISEETKEFGIDHATLGEKLACKWNFPESITSSIANHHQPLKNQEHLLLVSAINVADITCHALNIGDSGNTYVSEFFPETWQSLKLNRDELYKIIKDSLNEIESAKSLIYELQNS